MRVAVCIKQVPYVDQLKFDTKAGRLIREGVESEINPFDKRALAQAVNLKKEFGAETVVITMGPPQASAALREALAMGIDRAIHLLGRQFAGADTLATAHTLALALKKIAPDVVLCGKYSTDAETAQVPPMLAELIDWPQVTGVTRLEFRDHKNFAATRETDDGFQTVEGSLPVLLSAAERLAKPLKVTPQDLERVNDSPVETWGPDELASDNSLFGLSGSPTWVETIYSIEPKRRQIIRTVGRDVDSAVQQVVDEFRAQALFDGAADHRLEILPRKNEGIRPDKSIWTIAEVIEGGVRHVTFELLGRSIELTEKLDGVVGMVLIGSGVERYVETLAERGADDVYIADSPSLANYLTEPYAQVISDAIRKHNPYAVLFPATANGRDLAPRVAARLNIGLTGDCIGLEIDDQGRLVQLKPAFGGNIVAPILTKTTPAMASVRPGMMHKAGPQKGRTARVIRLPVQNLSSRVRYVSSQLTTDEGLGLDDAEVIIGVGMGVGGPENFPVLHGLADTLGAKLGATRRVVDAGWLPRQLQIGLTGRSVSPSLYIALGVRGAFNHMVGIQRAGTIVAVNNNPDADIFKHCDYGLVGDWKEIARALTRAWSEKRTPVVQT